MDLHHQRSHSEWDILLIELSPYMHSSINQRISLLCFCMYIHTVGWAGFEPALSAVQEQWENPLLYHPIKWAQLDLHQPQTTYEIVKPLLISCARLWQGLDSNQRRELTRWFYRPHPLNRLDTLPLGVTGGDRTHNYLIHSQAFYLIELQSPCSQITLIVDSERLELSKLRCKRSVIPISPTAQI